MPAIPNAGHFFLSHDRANHFDKEPSSMVGAQKQTIQRLQKRAAPMRRFYRLLPKSAFMFQMTLLDKLRSQIPTTVSLGRHASDIRCETRTGERLGCRMFSATLVSDGAS